MVHTFLEKFSQGQQALTQGRADDAFRCWLECKPTLPNDAHAHHRLANAFLSIGQLSAATNVLENALKQWPKDSVLHADVATCMLNRGEAIQSADLFEQTAETAEGVQKLSLLSNQIMSLEYAANEPNDKKLAVAENWGRLAQSWVSQMPPCKSASSLSNLPDKTTPIRVGFLSGDLCDHPVGFLLLPLLKNRTTELWTPFIYDNESRADRTHVQLRSHVQNDHWIALGGLDDTVAIESILADKLDVLIDLSGHTGRSRLRLMAYRLAKKQLSWLGFSGTTGLKTMDAVILDDYLARNAENQFIENILTLEHSRFCFHPPYAPSISPPPNQTNGYITFGSFNNTAKYNASLLKTWATIIKSVHNSRLILKWRTFADRDFCEDIFSQFSSHGISRERIELRGFSTHRQMLDEYNDVDISLDTFPFTGGFTSLESLFMGLPLITLTGDTPISRQSASFLQAINQPRWITHKTTDYIQRAVALASEPEILLNTRLHQRFKIMESPLYDAIGFTHRFETLLKNLSDRLSISPKTV